MGVGALVVGGTGLGEVVSATGVLDGDSVVASVIVVERAAAAFAWATEDSVGVSAGMGGAAAAGRVTRSGGGAAG